MNKEFIVESIDSGTRIDKYLCLKLEISRNLAKEYMEGNNVTVNGLTVKESYKVQENDKINVVMKELEEYKIVPKDLNLEYVYEDEYLCVVNKPSGMVVHPAAGSKEDTMVHGLMFDLQDSLSGINGVERPGIVHRIDKDTSGLLVVAKCDFAHQELSKQLENHSMERKYIALVYGVITENKGIINAPIGRDTKNRQKMAVVRNGKNAVTHFNVLKRYKDKTLIECILETGRTHQIRVHMDYIGHPVVGDPLYGHTRHVFGDNGQFLHAKILGFVHPKTLEFLRFDSELPEYFQDYINELEKELM